MFKVHTFPMDVSVTLDSNLQEYKDFALLFNLPYKLFLFQFSSGGFWKDLPVVSQKKRHPWPHASMALSLELLQTQLAAATAMRRDHGVYLCVVAFVTVVISIRIVALRRLADD